MNLVLDLGEEQGGGGDAAATVLQGIVATKNGEIVQELMF